MFLNNGREDFEDEDLEGSTGEHLIFNEVFFGYDYDTNSNKGLISGTSHECKLFKHIESPPFSNNGNSAITTQVKSCFVKEDLKDNSANWFSWGRDKSFLMSEHDGNNKWTKAPTDEISYSGTKAPTSGPSKRIVSGISQPANSVTNDFVICRLVESSSQGIISSCFVMELFAKNNGSKASKTISSPVSQENSELVTPPNVSVANNSVSHQSDKKGVISSECYYKHTTETALDRDFTINPKSFLRDHVQDLLRDAGWEIGRRNRKNISGEFLYYSPWKSKPIRELRRVWNLCGRRLFTDAKVVPQEDKKQWIDMTHFCSDLYNTVLEIEREMTGKKSAAALAQRWYILDPFVNTVFVDKKLNILKAGQIVKARRSVVIGTFESDALLQSDFVHIYGNQFDEESDDQPCNISGVDERPLTVSNTKEAGTWCRELSGNKRSREFTTSSKACGTDITYDYFDSSLFEVPVSYEDANIICGMSDAAFPSHVCVKICHSLDRHRFDNDEDIDLEVKENKAVGSYEAEKTFNVQINEIARHSFGNSYMVDVEIKVIQDLALIEQVHDIEKENIQLEQAKAEGYSIAANDCTTIGYRKSLMNSSHTGIGTMKNVKLEMFDGQNKRRHTHPSCQLKEDDIWYPATRKSKTLKSSTKKHDFQINFFKSEARKKQKRKKGSCRLVPKKIIKGKKQNERESSLLYVKTVLSWLVDCGVISLGETIQCRSKMNETVVKYGLITRDGILCKCCNLLLSLSKFRRHAGFGSNHPYMDLYMNSGKPFTICQLEAWSTEYKARESATQPVIEYGTDPNDDKCGLCGNMGELICCDNCPSTFHLECLETQELPEDCWYCMHCSCRICGDLVHDKSPLKFHNALMCLQCEHKYHRACLEEKGCRGVSSDDYFCCQSCQEVYRGLNSRTGFVNHISDGFTWTLLKCTHRDQSIQSAPDCVVLEAECNTKLAVALTIMEECFLSIVDSRTGIDMIPRVLYNWRSEFPRLDYNGFYTLVLEKDDVLLSVASIRIHGVTVAEMPLVATSSKFQRQGMFRRLLCSIEELLKSFKVEKIVVSALPSLVETWTIGFGFTLMEDHERNSLRDVNLMVFPGTVWLKKQIYGSPKTLQGHPLSSIKESRAETTYIRKRPIIDYQKHSFGRSTRTKAINEMEMRRMNSKYLLTEQEERHGSLYKHLLTLPWGEPEPSTGRIRVDVRAARENVFRMSQKAHASQHIC